jgi:hypothetical protein
MIKFSAVALALIYFMWSQCQKKDGAHAMRAGWFVAMLLCPAWQQMQVRSIFLDHRSIAAGFGLVLLFAFPRKDGLSPLKRFVPMPTDFFMGLLFLSIMTTVLLKEHMAPLTPFEFARQFLLPYIIGRLFLQRSKDIEDIAPVLSRVILIVTVLGILEAFTRRNLVNEVFGMHFGLLETGEGYRWGMKRAIGCVRHPIFNGLMLVMVIPWTVAVHHYWKRGPKRKLWRQMPLMGALAVFFSVSRGPHAAAIATGGIMTFFRKPLLRVPIAVVTIVLAVVVIGARDEIMHFAGKLAGEEEPDENSYISIDGELYVYTGTKHRELLNIAYAEAVVRNDWWGYGAGLDNVPIPDDARQRFSSIDNHYLMFFLQFGYSGFYLFHCVQFFAVLQVFCCAWNTKHGRSILCAGLTGSFVGVGLLIKSVWFDPDYATVWLFCAGLSACLTQVQDDEAAFRAGATDSEADTSPEKNVVRVRRRSLVPSYTPMPRSEARSQETGSS